MFQEVPNGAWQRDLMRALGRIEGQLSAVVSQQAQQLKTDGQHDERISALEQFKAKAAGIAALIGAIVGGLASLGSKLLLDLIS